eukprot:scaffold10632_cov23-Tisochrysis_lutea.AAC.1
MAKQFTASSQNLLLVPPVMGGCNSHALTSTMGAPASVLLLHVRLILHFTPEACKSCLCHGSSLKPPNALIYAFNLLSNPLSPTKTLQTLHTVRWSPNTQGSCSTEPSPDGCKCTTHAAWLAYGGAAGLVRCQRIAMQL